MCYNVDIHIVTERVENNHNSYNYNSYNSYSSVPVHIFGVPVLPVVMDGVQNPILQRLVGQILMDDTEQEIEVPKDLLPDRPLLRAVVSATQMVEQLVEVPVVSPTDCVLNVPVPQMGNELVEVAEVVSQSIFQLLFDEQTVDIPVLGCVEQDSPARRGADLQGNLQGFLPVQSSSAFFGVFKILSQN